MYCPSEPSDKIMSTWGESVLLQLLQCSPSQAQAHLPADFPAAAGHGAPSGHACAAHCASLPSSGEVVSRCVISMSLRAPHSQAEVHMRRMSQLRRDMGRLLGMRRTPRLEFRLDRLSAEQQAVEDAFRRLQAE